MTEENKPTDFMQSVIQGLYNLNLNELQEVETFLQARKKLLISRLPRAPTRGLFG